MRTSRYKSRRSTRTAATVGSLVEATEVSALPRSDFIVMTPATIAITMANSIHQGSVRRGLAMSAGFGAGCGGLVSVSIFHFSLAGRRARQRQFHLEPAALAFRALELHVAAVRGADGFDDGKPQPRAAHL